MKEGVSKVIFSGAQSTQSITRIAQWVDIK